MPVITCRSLNSIGRFGNTLFTYCFARGYALKHNCELQIPHDWIGRRIFSNVNEPPISNHNLQQTRLETHTKLPIGIWFGAVDCDINQYAQHQKHVDYYTRKQVREWLKVKPELEEICCAPKTPYSAIHLRRGDYEHEPYNRLYATVSGASYDKAIKQFNIPEPIITVGEGHKPPPAALPSEMSFLADFLTLRDASHLLRANSSFSLWAAWLGNGKVYSPAVEDKVGWQDVDFVIGNHANTAGRFRNQSNLILKE